MANEKLSTAWSGRSSKLPGKNMGSLKRSITVPLLKVLILLRKGGSSFFLS